MYRFDATTITATVCNTKAAAATTTPCIKPIDATQWSYGIRVDCLVVFLMILFWRARTVMGINNVLVHNNQGTFCSCQIRWDIVWKIIQTVSSSGCNRKMCFVRSLAFNQQNWILIECLALNWPQFGACHRTDDWLVNRNLPFFSIASCALFIFMKCCTNSPWFHSSKQNKHCFSSWPLKKTKKPISYTVNMTKRRKEARKKMSKTNLVTN